MKNPNEPNCWISLYVLRDKALIPTTYDTEDAVLLSDEPYWEFDYKNRNALINALAEAIEKGNPVIPTPDPTEFKKRKSTEKRAGTSSWIDLERKSICFSIVCWPSEYTLKAWGRAPNGAWGSEKEPALNVRIPADRGADGLADAILEHLKTRNDFQGRMSVSA